MAAGPLLPNVQFQLFKMLHQLQVAITLASTHLISERVCGMFVYVAFLFVLHSNTAVILPFQWKLHTILLHTSSMSLALLAVQSASAPQQALTCLHIFPIDPASFVSMNQRMEALQPCPLHLNTWSNLSNLGCWMTKTTRREHTVEWTNDRRAVAEQRGSPLVRINLRD